MAGRHYGMDWLRIGAFALLILYHIGMVFVPWDFHVNAAVTRDWLQYPMLALNPWRLALLFVVSGFASRNLLAKRGGAGAFAASRARRLTIPLLFGVAIIVPPQSWVELMAKHDYAQGFWKFWAVDYFRFGTLHGIILPTWNHLWFVVYLLVYTMIVAMLAGLLPGLGARAQSLFDRIFRGWGVVLLPAMWFFAVRSLLFPAFGETHALVDDWAAHALYFACFLFGMGLARSTPAWEAIRRLRAPAGLIGVTSGVAFLAADSIAPVELARLARSIFAWSTIIALIALADHFWNRDHPARAMLTEAVFPFYMIHQTIIILVYWCILPLGLSPATEFVLLMMATAAGCWIFYAIGRQVPGVRMLIGLEGWRPINRRSAAGTFPAAAAIR